MNRFFNLIRRTIVSVFTLAAIVTLTILYYMEFDLPDIDALNTVQLQVPLQIYTQDKKLIASFGEKRRIPVPYNQIPILLIDAVLATEDQRYFQHNGVDLQGLGRAAVQLVLTGRKSQGGSTITMQVARSFYLSRNKTFGRKLREILLAIKIEHHLSKQKILELYLNKIFLGNRAYGVEAAAQIYYGKHLNELSIDQIAMIAGLPQAPSSLNPLANPEAAKKRRDHVLSRMYEEGYISKADYTTAIQAPINASYHDLPTEVKAPYVAELARQQLEQMYGDSIYTDGFKVYTTIDSALQDDANRSLRKNLLMYDQRHGYRGSVSNLGIPSLDSMEYWEKQLRKIPTVNGLQPAAVVEMTSKTITVLRSNGDLTIIPWSGLSWARKQINADYLGPMPKSTAQIAKLGDVVYINQTDNGIQLAQIPKAEAGIVSINPQNGGILALVGGFDYQNSKFNRITNAQRQPGSSFKPFVYSAALDKGYTLASIINDAPIVIEQEDNTIWRPQNNERKFYGPTRLRTAIIESRNLVSIRLLSQIGLSYTVDYLKRFGFSPAQLPPGLSLALGTATVTPLQMAQAYAVFANGGMKVVPFIIDSIVNSQGETIYQAKPLEVCNADCKKDVAIAPRVISEQTAYLMTSAMQDVIERGTARLAKKLNREDLAGKTGTTQNQVDAWFAGFNPDLVTVSWVGFDFNQSLHEFGAQAALPIWIDFMHDALKNKPARIIPEPPGVVSVKINPYNGNRTSNDNPDGIYEYFMEPYLPGKDNSQPERSDTTEDEDNTNAATPSENAGNPSSTYNKSTEDQSADDQTTADQGPPEQN